ncbi:TonB-dependent receptor domain-containing protein, partial [Steroidobacter sp.]|uniref:TonB-dependent receptor domain-containing protein n=1 Tax=Steroidobacter sp. TaxID=1978227 RepID=UPI001A42C433
TRETNEFSSVDPTIALRWVPVQDLAVRLSYGTGTLPPSLSQLVPIGSAQTGLLYTASRDPRRGNTPTGQFTGLFNGNPDLEPEKSKSWSAGLIFTPSALPSLRLSLDYTRIQKIDNIGTIPNFVQGVIDNEALFPGRVVRGPNLSTDPVGWAGPITHVDATPLNLASAELKAWDVQIDYQLNTQQRGAFDLFLVGTYQPTYALQLMSGLPMVDYAGISSAYPLELKLNGGVNWTLSAWRAGWNVSYFDSYKVSTDATTIANQGGDGKVDSQIYHDAFVTYDVGLARGNVNSWLAGTQVQLGVRNVFNKKAPFDASNTMAYYSLFGNPRMASYYLTVTTKF